MWVKITAEVEVEDVLDLDVAERHILGIVVSNFTDHATVDVEQIEAPV